MAILNSTDDAPMKALETFINDVPRFLAIFDLPTFLVLLYNVPFLGLSWIPLPTLISNAINGPYLIRLFH